MRPDNAELRLLAARAGMGDDEAFAALVHRFTARLLWFVCKFGLNRATAEDVVQETWLVAWRKLPGLRKADRFRAWVYGIARNKALQHVSRTRDVLAPEPDPAEETPDDSFFDRYLPRLNDALNRLSLVHREVLALRFLEGLSYDELARATGAAAGTVKSRLHHAKIALRRELEVNAHD